MKEVISLTLKERSINLIVPEDKLEKQRSFFLKKDFKINNIDKKNKKRDSNLQPAMPSKIQPVRRIVKIGRPGYRAMKV